MSEGVVRALVVLLVVGGGFAAALAARAIERRRVGSTSLDLAGLTEGVLFFSDSACRRCDIVRDRLDDVDAAYVEIRYDEQPETHRRVGVTGVPLVVIREGDEVTRLAGVVSRRRLARAVASSR